MSEIAEKEKELATVIGTSNYPIIASYTRSPEGAAFLVQSFPELTEKNVQILVLETIFFWYNDKNKELPAELNELMYQLLFTVCVERYQSYDIEVRNYISKAQVASCFVNYPGNNAEFWQTMFGFGTGILDPFLIEFGRESSIYSAERLEIFAPLKAAMREQEVLPAIIKHVFDLLASDPTTGLRILNGFAHWCDLDFVSDEASMGLIVKSLENVQTTALVISLYETIIQRNANDESLGSIIEALINTESLEQIIEQSKEAPQFLDPIHEAIGSLVKTIGTITGDAGYFEFAMTCLLDASELAAVSVSPFICYYVSQQDKESFELQETFENSYNHLVSFFDDEEVTPAVYMKHRKFPLALSDICVSCFLLDPETCTQFVLSSLDGMNPLETPAISAALSFLILQMCNFSSIQNHLTNYVEKGIAITHIQPPYSPQELSAFYIFILMSAKTPDKINLEAKNAIFGNFMTIVGTEGISQEDLSLFLDEFARIVPQFASNLEVGSDITQPLFETMKPEFVLAAAAVSQSQQKTRDERFHELYPVYQQAIEQNAENPEELMNSVKCTLQFLKAFTISVKLPPEEGEPICDFLLPYSQENDDLLSLYITCVGNICSNAMERLAPLIESVASPKALFMLTNVTAKFYKDSMEIEQISEFFNQVMNAEFASILSCYEVELTLNRKISEELMFAISRFTEIVKNQFSYIEDDLKAAIFEFAKRCYTHEITSVFMFLQAVTLLALFRDNTDELFAVVSTCAMPIVLSNSISAISIELVNPLKKHKKLMKILIEADEEKASQTVQALAEIGIDPEYAASFLVNGELKINNDTSKQIFLDMRKMFLTSGV